MEQQRPAKAKLEEALLALLKNKRLQEIGISELCSTAGVSRSTFYANYTNVEAMYRELVQSLASKTRTLREQLKNGDCISMCPRKPFCETIQEEKFSGLAREDRFIKTFIEVCYEGFEDEIAAIYLDATEDRFVAKMINVFQLTGCLAAAMAGKDNPDWESARKVIDAFIRGGVSALRGLK